MEQRRKRCENCNELCEYTTGFAKGIEFCNIEQEIPERIEICPKEYLED